MGPHPNFLNAFAETRAFLAGRPSRIQITPDGGAVLFLRSGPRDAILALYEHDVATGQTKLLACPADLLGGVPEKLSEAEKTRRERLRIVEQGFTSYAVSPDGARVLLPLSGRLFVLDRRTGRSTALSVPSEPVVDPRFSPDGTRVAFVCGYDLWLVGADHSGESPRPLTCGGHENLLRGLAEFVAQEEMARHEGYWWSPDGGSIAFAEVNQSEVERFAIADPARPERPPMVFAYPRPGKANARVRLGIVSAQAEPTPVPLWVTWDDVRYPYLARVLWDVAQAPLTILVQTRDQREVALLAVDTATGQTRPLLVEADESWVELDRRLPCWLPDGSGLLWVSERHGRRELELRRPEGALERVVVNGAEGFLALCHVERDAAHAWVLLGDAITNRIVSVPLRGEGRKVVTARDLVEHAPIFSRDGALFVDARVSATGWPEAVVCGADGRVRSDLPSVAEEPPFPVSLELTSVTGTHCYHAAIVRPRTFDPRRRYPVLVHVYGGPHALMVKADARNYLLAQWIADHGVVVVHIDNRGTPRRDRAWERAIKGSFADVPLDDQVEALQALGARHPELDLSRIGIFGWSFGGYMAALAVLKRPDIFKVAAAGAPVVDWRDYDTHYTERYLDLPDRNPNGYRHSSLVSHAPGLARPLLLVHGTADDNVYFFHSLKLAEALLRAGRPFELLPLPGVTHQVSDAKLRQELWRRIVEFLLHHLET